MTSTTFTSRLPGFHRLSWEERRERLMRMGLLSPEAFAALVGEPGLTVEQADTMIENVIGVYALPLGVATNFVINGREVLIPMAVEEPSIVAAASHMAKIARAGGGFHAHADPPVMIGQIQLVDVPAPHAARMRILAHKAQLLEELRDPSSSLQRAGGGPRDLEVRLLEHPALGTFLVVHLHYDVRDAMGANAVNTACERLAPALEALTGGRAVLRILSNLADRRLARAWVRIPPEALAFREYAGETVRDGIVAAWAFAAADPYRAATHNKGIMNGIDPVLIATGNDWRAVEAGAHAYAARHGRYTSLSTWEVDAQGHLVGSLELPMAVGIIGGATRAHPAARAALRLLGVKTAQELAGILAAVGLAQNLAALRALATEGIQRGHMRLHARQIAMAAGAEGPWVERIARRMVEEGQIRLQRAKELLAELQAAREARAPSPDQDA
ncbi:MAG: hydroxymethylglutaryl-CoA reductase, degradative [Chloroflexi bacterium]|nr:hydroxymethylglutaryl-CoA reductase, degradative [Chloroflexota bacterium]